jgi:hypothetical protein
LRRQELVLLRLYRELVLLFALAQAAEGEKKEKNKCSEGKKKYGNQLVRPSPVQHDLQLRNCLLVVGVDDLHLQKER